MKDEKLEFRQRTLNLCTFNERKIKFLISFKTRYKLEHDDAESKHVRYGRVNA